MCGETQERRLRGEPILAALAQGPQMDPRMVSSIGRTDGGG
jgi:hypothetical protein